MTLPYPTAAQQQVVDHEAGTLRVLGGAGTGKTTALVQRYLRLAAEHGAGRVLVLARDRGGAGRFRDAVLPHLRGAWEDLPITTGWGLAFDVVTRHGGPDRPVRLLRGAEQRALVRQMLDAERGDRTLWPTLSALVGRRAFAEEVAEAVLDVQRSLLGVEDVRRAVAAAGGDQRWDELARFLGRYLAVLDDRHMVDGAGVTARAVTLLSDPAIGAATAERHPVTLADDYEAATVPARNLVERLVAHGSAVAVAANPALAVSDPPWRSSADLVELGTVSDVALDRRFRDPAPGVVVRCRHPAMEPEAVVGELLAARQRGVQWEAMAVLVRQPARRDAVTRALARHAIPVSYRPGPVAQEPTVGGLLDLLRSAHGDERAFERLLASPLSGLDPAEVRRLRRAASSGGSPLAAQPEVVRLAAIREELARRAAVEDVAALAHRAFRLALAHLVPEPGRRPVAHEERALDAVVAFLDGLTRHVERHPGADLTSYLDLLEGPVGDGLDPWLAPSPAPGTVAVTSVTEAAGREWDTVVLAGCVEGEWPRVSDGLRFFDRALLDGGRVPSVAERRRASLAQERRLFALAGTRAATTVVGTAAPEPGVHVSRFVEAWPERPPRPVLHAATPPPPLPPTPGTGPMWPGGSLWLSASQLGTFEDCPLKHAYRYAVGVRSAGGLHAGLGLVVHEVLARFLDPAGPSAHTQERLYELAEACWRHDLAPYRPQLEEARRDLYEMLDLWWEHEGSLIGPGGTVLATERPFTIGVGRHRVTGRIDRVDREPDGHGIRLVDYKSGKRKPRADDVAQDLQLATYRLAALRDDELAAWGPPARARIVHLRSMAALDQEAEAGDSDATEARIVAMADRILAEEVEPSVDADCDHCELHRLCPLWPEGREVGEE